MLSLISMILFCEVDYSIFDKLWFNVVTCVFLYSSNFDCYYSNEDNFDFNSNIILVFNIAD